MEEERGRRQFTSEQKLRVVKEALTTDLGVSGVCRKHGISTTLFYQWQEKFFAGALEGLRRLKKGASSVEQRKIDQLEKENGRMKSVIAEITSENIAFKKNLGEL